MFHIIVNFIGRIRSRTIRRTRSVLPVRVRLTLTLTVSSLSTLGAHIRRVIATVRVEIRPN